MWTPALGLGMALLAAAPGRAAERPVAVGHFLFAEVEPADAALDQSGFGHHGKLVDSRRGREALGPAITLGPKGHVALPGGRALFGSRARSGAVELWARPSFGPDELPGGQWEGYRALFYAMQTDGNGLPDGYEEIGLFVHGKMLCAKVCGQDRGGPFAVLPSPLRKDEWAHLAMTWSPEERALYVNGEPVAVDRSAGAPPQLDDFPAEIGRHPSSKNWNFAGNLAGVRLFAQALTRQQVRESFRRRESLQLPAGRGRAAVDPGAAWVEGAQWGAPWRGENTVRFRLTNRGAGATAVQVTVRASEPGVLATATPRRMTLAADASTEEQVSYRIAGEGAFRLFLLAADDQDAVLGAAAAEADIPVLAPRVAELARRLDAVKAECARAGYPAVARTALGEQLAAVGRELQALRDLHGRGGRPEAEALAARLPAAEAALERLARRARAYASAREGRLPAFGLGVDSGLRKYLRDDPFQGAIEAPIALSAARGEAESAQLLVLGLDEPVKGVTVTLGPLVGPGGARLEDAVKWNLVGFVPTTKPTYEVRYVGLWPDPLLSPRKFDVPAGGFETIWLTVTAPRTARPGDYLGEIALTPENAPARKQALRLHVWDFDLPERSRLTTAFGLNCLGAYEQKMDLQRYLENARDHRISLGFPGAAIRPATYTRPSFDWTGVEKVVLRISAEGAGEPPPLHLHCETGDRNAQLLGPIAVPKTEAEVAVPVSGLKLFSALRLECRDPKAVTYTLRGLRLVSPQGERVFDDLAKPDYWRAAGPWSTLAAAPGGLAFRVQPGTLPAGQEWLSSWPAMERTAAGSPADVDWTFDFKPFDESIERALAYGLNAIPLPLPSPGRTGDVDLARRFLAEQGTSRVAKAYADHLRERGWLGMAYSYVSDEPEPDQYAVLNLVMREIRKGAPDLRNMMTARSFPAELTQVDVWCPEVYSFDPELAAREQAKGKLVWWYPAFSTRHPFPDFWVDYPAIDCRIIFWMTWKHHLDGLLYWSVSNWYAQDPWKNAATFPGANGDGTLIYPGEDGGPVNSIRWENLRDGSEDYDYFALLKERVARLRARPKAAKHAPLLRKAEALLAIDDRVCASWKQYSLDPADLLRARQEMGDCLEQVTRLLAGQGGKQP